MASLEENLQVLEETKANLKTALESKGLDLTDVPFTEYSTKAESLEIVKMTEYVEIMLPNEFIGTSNIAEFSVTSDKILLSPKETADAGLWLYTVSSQTLIQVCSHKVRFSLFQMVGDKCLVSSNTYSAGLWLFDPNTDSCTQLVEYGSMSNFIPVTENKCLISGRSVSDTRERGIYLYDSSNGTLSHIYDEAAQWVNGIQIGESAKWLISTNTTTYAKGILLYNSEDDSIKSLYDVGYGFTKIVSTDGEHYFISSQAQNKVLILYNFNDDSVIKIETQGYSFTKIVEFSKNKYLLASEANGTAFAKLVSYDLENNTSTDLYFESGVWNYLSKVGTKCLISSTNTKGLLLYDSVQNSVVKIYENGMSWQYPIIFNNKCLLSGNSSGSQGILLYNGDDDSLALIRDTGYGYQNSLVVGDKILISSFTGSYNSAGLYIFNTLDDTLSQIYTTGSGWNIFAQVSEYKWLICGAGSNGLGILMYNSSTDTVAKLYSNGYGYDIFTHDVDNNYFISSSDKTKSVPYGRYILYYIESTDTISLVGYSLEVTK